MGTINYKTGNYITIGYNLKNINYSIDDFSYENIIIDDYENIKDLLNLYNFYYYHIEIKPGYYDGFSIDIEYNFSYCLYSYQDKKDALKEITQIKKFLLDCINNYNCCAISPGWCTTYYDYKNTIEQLKNAIKEMQDEIRNTPTHYKLKLTNDI